MNESDKWAKTREWLNRTNMAANLPSSSLDEVDVSEAEHAQLDEVEDDEAERVAQQLKQLREEYGWLSELQNVWEAIDDLR